MSTSEQMRLLWLATARAATISNSQTAFLPATEHNDPQTSKSQTSKKKPAPKKRVPALAAR